MDIHSFSIWQDYISFLRSVEAVGSYAENQKITAVRRVYQKAVITPIVGIEILWKDYIAFEHNINPIISEKMSLERSKDYMNARRVAKELENITKGLNRNLPAILNLSKREVKQVNLKIILRVILLFNDCLSFIWGKKRLNYGRNLLPLKNPILYVRKIRL
ncbi:hypothetical protein DOY81_009795 [Sarcophaga bullata]|nr:hypothetical protein DOY81_009795 [Sarcophaga bullata]